MNEIYIVAIFILFVFVGLLIRSYFRIRKLLMEALSKKQSLSTKYGRMSEQFMPFLRTYPYDEQNFRFLGTPVDGVQFNDDGIVFVEFKTSGSKLTPKQKSIKDMIERKKVRFDEIRMS